MKQRIIHLTLFMFSFFVINKHAIAQSPGDAFKKLASLPLQSPQAASLSKYVEFPISYYNGLAQISLPIYEVVTGDISVPVSLSYHGGGIKVQEEAGWVGLGWTLNAGGVITHEIKGDDDEWGVDHPFNKVYPNDLKNVYNESAMALSSIGCSALYNNIPALYDCNTLFTLLNGGKTDGEPDIYVYNFGNYCGKFFSGDGQFVDLSHNNIQFTKQLGTGFTAFTPDGYTYVFNAVEKAWAFPTPHATNTAYYLTEIISPKGKTVFFQYKTFRKMIDEHNQAGQVQWSNQFPNISTAWGNDETVLQLPGLSENYSTYKFIGGNQIGSEAAVQVTDIPGLHQSYSSTSSTNLYLDKITFDKGYIEFVKSPRNDLYGIKLDAIKIFSSNGNLVKSVPFSYSYFVSNKGDDDLYDRNKVKYPEPYDAHVDYYPQSFRNQRLKLLDVMIESSPYRFDYHDGDQYTTLPYKTSFNQDLWGYYNGPKGNASLIPDYGLYSLQTIIPTELSSWKGANRTPDDNYVRAGLLKKITYPTGGNSYFTYEMNQFSNLTSQQQTVYREAKYGGVDAGVGTKYFYFTLANETHCDITGGLYCNEMLDMNASTYNCSCLTCPGTTSEALYASVNKVNPTTHEVLERRIDWEFDIHNNNIKNAKGYISLPNQTFAAGTYCITVNYPDNHTPPGDVPNNRRAELYVSFNEPVTGQSNSSAIGAGLRVSSIKNFDPVNMKTLEKQFSYTGGKLMRYPTFNSDAKMQYSYLYSNPYIEILYTSDYRFYYLYSTPTIPFSFSANGSAVGYDMVTVRAIGPSLLGKTQYEYKNRCDIFNNQPEVYLPGIPTNGFLDNGFLNRVTTYDNSNSLLNETLNQAEVALTATYWPFKSRLYTNEVSTYNLLTYLQMSFYPVQVGKLLTTKTTVNDYANGSSITNIKDFSYNENGLLRQENFSSSEGSALTTNYAYATDYTGVNSGWIKDLKDRNMIAIPIEVYSKKNSLVIGGSFTSYLNHDNIITPNKVYKIETSSAKNIASTVPNAAMPTELKISGTLNYDANGNLTQTQTEKDIPTSYLWGYNKTYPLASAVNAESNEIFFDSFEEGTGWDSNLLTIDNSKSHSGRYSGRMDMDGSGEKVCHSATWLSVSLAAPTKYKFSGWIYSNGPTAQIFLFMRRAGETSYFTYVASVITYVTNQWTYVEGEYEVPTDITQLGIRLDNNGDNGGGSVWFDDIRLHPSAAQMTTYTYDPLIGITSQTDVNNRTIYYEYDSFGRLSIMRDKDRNILKKYCYNYAGQQTTCID